MAGRRARPRYRWAAALGHDALYLFTQRDSTAQRLYRRLGWQTIRTGRYEDIDVTLMRADLVARA